MAVVGHRKDEGGQLAIQVHNESIWGSLHESEEGTHGEAREEELCQKQDRERGNLTLDMTLVEWVEGQEEGQYPGYTCGVLSLR